MKDGPRSARLVAQPGAPDLEGLALEQGRRAGRRPEGAHRPFEFDRRPRPVEPCLLFLDLARIGNAHRRLLLGLHPARLQVEERRSYQVRAKRRELIVQGTGVLILSDRKATLRKQRPGIQTRVHPHDRNPRFTIAREKRALNRRGAAPARQERGMNVQRSVRSDNKERRRQDHAVRSDH